MKVGRRLDASELALYLAGSIGQASLDRLDGSAHPVLDQHVAAVTEAVTAVLGRHARDSAQMLGGLVRYACGFVDAAIAGGWRPAPDDQPEDDDHQEHDYLDWESMRLAAVCLLVSRLSDGA